MTILKTEKVQAGQALLVTSGEYSDFGIVALCKALRDFDVIPLIAEYKAMNPKETHFNYSEFGDWLIEKAYVEKLPYAELYMGSYGDVDPKVSEGF